MDKFTELHNRVNFLKEKYKDKKNISNLLDISKFIDTQKDYYDSIPSNIRTSNTLYNIYTSISKKIDQIEFVEKNVIPTIIYEDEQDTKDSKETITMAYLTESNKENNLQKINKDNLQKINKDNLQKIKELEDKNIELINELDAQRSQVDKSKEKISDLQLKNTALESEYLNKMHELQDLQIQLVLISEKYNNLNILLNEYNTEYKNIHTFDAELSNAKDKNKIKLSNMDDLSELEYLENSYKRAVEADKKNEMKGNNTVSTEVRRIERNRVKLEFEIIKINLENSKIKKRVYGLYKNIKNYIDEINKRPALAPISGAGEETNDCIIM